MKKWMSLLLLLTVGLSVLAGCGGKQSEVVENAQANQETVTLKIGVPTAPPALPLLYMVENQSLGEQVTLELDIWNTPEQLIAMIQDGGHDLFALPLTVAAKLYNKGMDITLMNVNTWGVTYFLTSDENFQEWGDLQGKTIYVPLQSSPPDALTQYFLSQAGLTVGEDVQIIYASTAEVSSLLVSGEAVYATQIEPQVTAALVQNPKLRRALSFEEEWQRVTSRETLIPNAGFGAMTSFIEDNPEMAQAFQKAYQEGVEWVLANPSQAAALAEEKLGMKAAIVEKAIPYMGLYYKNAEDAQQELAMFYQLLNDFDPTMIGGQLPDEGLYYHEQP